MQDAGKRRGKEEKKMKKLIALALVLALACAAGLAMAEGTLGGETKTGGWAAAENPEITEEVRAVFDKGTEGLLGVNYTPVALLGSQVVAGRNYAILCQAAVVAPNAHPSWKILYLYQDLEGNVSILNIADFDFGALCTYGAAPEAE